MRVVLLNSNPAVLKLAKVSLERLGYEFAEATSADEVGECDLLICDSAMISGGVEYENLARAVLYLMPRGYENIEGKNVVEKPFLPTDFVDAIKSLVEKHQLNSVATLKEPSDDGFDDLEQMDLSSGLAELQSLDGEEFSDLEDLSADTAPVATELAEQIDQSDFADFGDDGDLERERSNFTAADLEDDDDSDEMDDLIEASEQTPSGGDWGGKDWGENSLDDDLSDLVEAPALDDLSDLVEAPALDDLSDLVEVLEQEASEPDMSEVATEDDAELATDDPASEALGDETLDGDLAEMPAEQEPTEMVSSEPAEEPINDEVATEDDAELATDDLAEMPIDEAQSDEVAAQSADNTTYSVIMSLDDSEEEAQDGDEHSDFEVLDGDMSRQPPSKENEIEKISEMIAQIDSMDSEEVDFSDLIGGEEPAGSGGEMDWSGAHLANGEEGELLEVCDVAKAGAISDATQIDDISETQIRVGLGELGADALNSVATDEIKEEPQTSAQVAAKQVGEELSRQIGEQVIASINASTLKEALKDMNIKISISFEERV